MVSLILPIYQAEAFLRTNLERLAQYVADTPSIQEIILVNDGSQDDTHEIIEQFLAQSPSTDRFQYILLKQNRGKGTAIKEGVRLAKGQFLIFTDCDLPYAFENIDNVIAHLVNQKAHFVVGNRMHPDSTYHIRPQNLSYIYIRHTGGRFYNWMINQITRLNLADTQAGLKGFDRETATLCFDKMTINGFAFDVDLLVCAQANNRQILSVPLTFYYESEMGMGNFVKNTLLMSLSLFCIVFKKWTGFYLKAAPHSPSITQEAE